MKKTIFVRNIFIIIIVLISLVITACAEARGEYQKIRLSGASLGVAYEEEVTSITKVNFDHFENASEIPKKIPIYKIKLKEIDKSVFDSFKGFFGINEDDITQSSDFKAVTDTDIIYYRYNENTSCLTYHHRFDLEASMKFTDEELEQMAKEYFAKIPFIDHDQYEYVGITSTQSISGGGGVYKPVKQRLSFRKVIDGMRVTGDDQCDLYIDAEGLCGVTINFFEYEKIGEMDLVTLNDAKKRVKTPDAFARYDENDTLMKGETEWLNVERVKLLLVNQFRDGCTILQPIYNFIGTATNETGSAEFHSRIIAIPDKYTFDASYPEGEPAG